MPPLAPRMVFFSLSSSQLHCPTCASWIYSRTVGAENGRVVGAGGVDYLFGGPVLRRRDDCIAGIPASRYGFVSLCHHFTSLNPAKIIPSTFPTMSDTASRLHLYFFANASAISGREQQCEMRIRVERTGQMLGSTD